VRKTLEGRLFRCLPVREILHDFWPGREGCAYVQRPKKYFDGR
jgi:hypothetical protein